MARRKIDLEGDNRVIRHNVLVNQPINQATQQKVSRNIINEKLNVKNTSVMNMINLTTQVTWYHLVNDGITSNFAIDTTPVSGIAFDDKKYDIIRNYDVRLDDPFSPTEEGDQETIRSQITEGSLTILPRTIKPNENDMFSLVYLDKLNFYRVTEVTPVSLEQDAGFKCSFSLFESDRHLTEKDFEERLQINRVYQFHMELVGSSYRPIITYDDEEFLTKMRKLYNTVGEIFIENCYDKALNTYFIRYEGKDSSKITDINNIYRFHRCPQGCNAPPNYRGYVGVDYHYYELDYVPINVYDNLLIYFMKKHRIFEEINKRIVCPDLLLPVYDGMYMRSIFAAVEERDDKRFKNKHTIETAIKVQEPGTSALLVGKYIVSHEDAPSMTSAQLLSQTLIDLIVNKPLDLTKPFREKEYNSYSALISEIIAKYVLRISSDHEEPLLALYENMSYLYKDSVMSENIFYLYPLLGYVINRTLEEKFKDNTIIKTY